MDFLCCGSSLPHIWAIEALACSKHVETFLLLDLLKKTPKICNHMGKNAREMVSLKIIESLFVQGARANPVSSPLSKTVRLDPSDHCEDVLRRILSETSLSHLEPAGSEMSKWDLEPFIVHKRSSLPKCALKQLKDAILTGSNSISASLKEQSGLPGRSHAEHQVPVKDGNCNGITPRVEGNDTDDGYPLPKDLPHENLVLVNSKRKASERPSEHLCTTHVNPAKKNKHEVISNEKFLGEQLIYSEVKGKRFGLERITNAGNMGLSEPLEHDTNECTSSGLGDPNEVLPCGNQVRHCDAGLNNKSGEQRMQDYTIDEVCGKYKACDLKKSNEDVDGFELHRTNIDRLEEKSLVSNDNDGDDDEQTDIVRKENTSLSSQYTCKQDSFGTTKSRDQILLADTSQRYSEERCSLEKETCIEVTRLNRSPRDSIENGREGFHGVISANEYIDKFDQNVPRTVPIASETEEVVVFTSDNDGYRDERKSIDEQKKIFLSSQCTYSQDLVATTDSRELHLCMKCNKGGSLLSCTSDSCPIGIHETCLVTDASIDTREAFYCPFCAYSQALSMYMETKKNTSLARKYLETFICVGPPSESNEQTSRSPRIDGNCLKENDSSPRSDELNQMNAVEKVSNHQRRKKLEFEQVGPSEVRSEYSPPFGRKSVESTDRVAQSLKGDKQDGKRMNKESQPPRGLRKQPKAAAAHKSQSETTSCQVSETSGNGKHADVRSKKGVPRPQSFQSTDAEELSEEENEDSGASKYFVRFRKQERKNMFPVIPQMRSRRLPWTKEEEDKLKEGISTFCSPNEPIPWKKILEFGEGVFHSSRSATALKIKWWNMCKASPKSK